jgi:hypothetical protein
MGCKALQHAGWHTPLSHSLYAGQEGAQHRQCPDVAFRDPSSSSSLLAPKLGWNGGNWGVLQRGTLEVLDPQIGDFPAGALGWRRVARAAESLLEQLLLLSEPGGPL